ncbi:hypothetical protein RclHR1_05050009 [Rhizophagus clarus]|uniref:Uncharacterized protein n=1 Tax=Rhizophagus clarus TaxID=94130 RepID=A0A2Z6RLQ7_9GLOM|nr:hypothetical protein RclHR1_05050009 [Rhizophagus clarus]
MNKSISEMAVRVLWENPFKFYDISNDFKSYVVIQNYIKCFNEEELNEISLIFKKLTERLFMCETRKIDEKKVKKIMKQYNQTPPLFEYGKYLKELGTNNLKKAISF